jgi:hypothetical protein
MASLVPLFVAAVTVLAVIRAWELFKDMVLS